MVSTEKEVCVVYWWKKKKKEDSIACHSRLKKYLWKPYLLERSLFTKKHRTHDSAAEQMNDKHVSPAESKDTVVFRRRILSTVGECVCMCAKSHVRVKCACTSVQPRRAWWIRDDNSYDDYTSNIVIRENSFYKEDNEYKPRVSWWGKQKSMLPSKTFWGPTKTLRTACTRWNVL